ncbi:MAG TPA: hypothetical protein VF363_05840 [Candidatus Eisenbacteria bacterium]
MTTGTNQIHRPRPDAGRAGTWPRLAAAALLLVSLAWTASARAQQFLIDKPVHAGELTVFPDLNDPMQYYYVNDKARLATDENGEPVFSFLQYVKNVRSGSDQPEAREGEGGAIVHAEVTLGVTPEQIQDAQRELSRKVPGAKIMGPVVYKSGKFSLTTSFKDTNGELTKQVVGLGNAPILDGEKAAISMQLTAKGATILWNSFKTAAPDIDFAFEMQATGYRSPHRAVIEANFDQIYEHQSFGVGFASKYLAAEIKAAFDDLRRSGAIKLTEIGPDEKMDALITTAYNKIAEMMFSPLNNNAVDLGSVLGAAGGNGASLLDRATSMLEKNQAAAKADNEKIRAENDRAQAAADARNASAASNAPRTNASNASAGSNARGAGGAGADSSKGARGGNRAAADSTGGKADSTAGDAPRGYHPQPASLQPNYADAAKPNDQPGPGSSAPAANTAAPKREEETVPQFSVIATFEMKKVHQQGTFKVDLNKYTTDDLTLPFSQNIGNLSKLMSDPRHFLQVNLDDPLYKQRELVVMVDGMNAKDFGDYVNFATVQMRKKHQGGEETQDEVRIDRNNFNKEGNNFKLMYGWNGDNDRKQWMNYEYQTTWSFFGGKELQDAWKPANAGAIDLAPPFQKRSVDLQADPDAITQAGVRSITVKVFYKLGDAEQVKQVTLNASKGQLSDKIDFILPADKTDYDYEITWHLKGNKTVTSGRKSASDAVLFVDEVPAG